ncbi:MAG: TetR family transcriptional regulator [Gemmatimonadetes bacterium]|nr:TetR family transcriptional regulator [Gemmatimonadota bacterium]
MPGRRETEEVRREAILRACFTVAAREGLGGVTARAVATEADVSSGLVFFYFASVDNLLVELLDWLLPRTIISSQFIGPPPTHAEPGERLMSVIRQDVERLPRQRARLELFFDYWVLGLRDPNIRRKIRRAADRYRASFRPLGEALIEAHPHRYADVSAEGLADVVASFVEGCALQVVMHPAQFDIERSMATLAALVRQPQHAAIH